jgi:hypothetical protein
MATRFCPEKNDNVNEKGIGRRGERERKIDTHTSPKRETKAFNPSMSWMMESTQNRPDTIRE